MQPEDVLSPRARTRNHRILFKSDVDQNGEGWSLCEAEVRQTNDDDDQEWNVMVGFRWDGVRDDPNSRGFPNTSGQGIWTWFPFALAEYFVGHGGIIRQLKESQRRDELDDKIRRIARRLRAIQAEHQLSATPPA